ncbi:MAG: CDP-alcohol phosphatidyltransferase family protein, partial [Pseudomonadota bacterium]
MTLPNAITLCRLALVPMVVWLMQTGADGAAFALFLLAGLSDAADGYIAKRWNMTSQLGAYLDPLADKLLIVAILVELACAGGLPLWIVAVVLARDAFIVAAIAASWSLGRAIA